MVIRKQEESDHKLIQRANLCKHTRILLKRWRAAAREKGISLTVEQWEKLKGLSNSINIEI